MAPSLLQLVPNVLGTGGKGAVPQSVLPAPRPPTKFTLTSRRLRGAGRPRGPGDSGILHPEGRRWGGDPLRTEKANVEAARREAPLCPPRGAGPWVSRVRPPPGTRGRESPSGKSGGAGGASGARGGGLPKLERAARTGDPAAGSPRGAGCGAFPAETRGQTWAWGSPSPKLLPNGAALPGGFGGARGAGGANFLPRTPLSNFKEET